MEHYKPATSSSYLSLSDRTPFWESDALDWLLSKDHARRSRSREERRQRSIAKRKQVAKNRRKAKRVRKQKQARRRSKK